MIFLGLKAAQHRMCQTRAIALEGQPREQAGLSYSRGCEQTRPGWLHPRWAAIEGYHSC